MKKKYGNYWYGWRRWSAGMLAVGMLAGMTGCGGRETDSGLPNTQLEETAEVQTEVGNSVQKDDSGITALSLMEQYNNAPMQIIDDKYRNFYEVFIYSFYDSDGDGIGDLNGLTKKLDYINDGDESTDTDLGCNGIWLMPVMPSATYHKYDVIDYMNIDEQYGTLEDFDSFMEACEERDIHVLIDLVMNHTSSKHLWFTEACDYLRGLGDAEPDSQECAYVDYYHFSREKKSDIYYPVEGTQWYYEGSFWSEMPDLNLQNPQVRKEFEEIVSFWLDRGVSGFRVDAAKEFESGNTTANVEILSWLNAAVKEKKPDAYIVAEVWTDMDTYAEYYGSGIDSVFNFAFGQQNGVIANALNHVSGAGAISYGKAAASLEKRFGAYNPDYIDAPFYTNHDIARSAGYYSGEGSEEKTKLAQAMNLMMSGNVFLYYGEELGMKGSGKDENKRAPMYWSENPQAEGMCSGPEGMEDISMKFPALEIQEKDGGSVYHFVRQALCLRNQYPAIARGKTVCLEELSDEDVCVMKKEYEGKELALVWNLGAATRQILLDSWEIGENAASDSTIAGVLLTGTEDIVMSEGRLIIPPYSMVLLAEKEK